MRSAIACGGKANHCRARVCSFLAAIGFCTVSAVSTAQPQDDPQHPEVLAKRLVRVIGNKDSSGRLALIHPLTRACMSSRNHAYFDWVFKKQASLAISSDYKVTVTSTGTLPTVIPADGHSDYPVRPTHQLQIDFVRNQYDSTSIILYASLEAGQWREVLPCPRDDVVRRAQERSVEERGRQETATKLTGELPGALRAELDSLLAQGRKVEAIRRYAAATGSDISVSKDVIEHLLSREVGQ